MTVREKCMLFFINKITDKPEWFRKVNNEEIVAKWQKEADDLMWESVGIKHGDMSSSMFDQVSGRSASYVHFRTLD